MRKIYKSIIFASSFFGALAQAAPGDWTPAKKISSIFVEGTDAAPRATLVIAGGLEESFMHASCRSQYLSIDLSSDKGKSIYSLALSARIADKNIQLSLPGCLGNRPLIDIIQL